VYLASDLPPKNSTLYTNEKSRYLPKITVSFMIVQLFQPISNRFTAVFRRLYYKIRAYFIHIVKLKIVCWSAKVFLFFNNLPYRRKTFYAYSC